MPDIQQSPEIEAARQKLTEARTEKQEAAAKHELAAAWATYAEANQPTRGA
jgi:hypothetical protein